MSNVGFKIDSCGYLISGTQAILVSHTNHNFPVSPEETVNAIRIPQDLLPRGSNRGDVLLILEDRRRLAEGDLVVVTVTKPETTRTWPRGRVD